MLFFTSDLHFGDDGIIRREKRPFRNAKHFLKVTTKRWNKQAKKDDTIYVLGDFFNYNKSDQTSWEKTMYIVKKFKAKVILIIGNNEERIILNKFDNDFEKFRQALINNGFYDVKTEDYVSFGDRDYYLNHMPINHKDNYINLFGHVHRATGLWKPFGLNISCDMNYYELHNEDSIISFIKEKERYWDSDPNVNS